MDGPKTLVKRVKVDIPREFIQRTIDYNNLESGIAAIKETIKDFDKLPILNLTINNVESDTSGVYEIINEELGDLALMIRPKFNMFDMDDPDVIIEENQKVGPKELIIKQLEGYGNSDVDTLATDLYDLLSKDKIDESSELINQFYDEHYANVKEDAEFKTEKLGEEQPPQEEEKDKQVTFKEVLE